MFNIYVKIPHPALIDWSLMLDNKLPDKQLVEIDWTRDCFRQDQQARFIKINLGA